MFALCRLLIVRYEDFALDPIREIHRIHRFLGLEYTAPRIAFTATQTMNTIELAPTDSFSTIRNAKKRAFEWVYGLPFDKIMTIQNLCEPILRVFNYHLFSPNDSAQFFQQ